MTTKLVNIESIGSYFESLSDPRHTRNRKHLLVDVVVIAVCGMLCGSDGPTAIHRWADNRRDWLEQFLSLPNGIPSTRLPSSADVVLKPEAFQGCFQDWLAHAIQTDNRGPKRLIAIDGKTCRGSHDAAKQLGPLHIVQRLGQRGRDRLGPGRYRGEIQRNHSNSRAIEADRAQRLA